MTSDEQLHADALREWARGSTTLVAATELLIRSGFAQKGRPWVHYDEERQRPWIDFDEIPDLIGGKSGGEKRLLRIAASLGGSSTSIVLGDEVAGLDRFRIELVSIAIIHAAGFTETTSDIVLEDGEPRRINVPPLASWPEVSQ
jgi:hypothetical protein